MRIASEQDLDRAVRILEKAFARVPAVTGLIPRRLLARGGLYELCRYCVELVFRGGGPVYFSDDENGVCLVQDTRTFRLDGRTAARIHLRVARRGLGWPGAVVALFRKKWLARLRTREPQLYVWMIGLEDPGLGRQTIFEFRKSLFALSDRLGLPIVAENAEEGNRLVFTRFGFVCYRETRWMGKPVWFIRRDPEVGGV